MPARFRSVLCLLLLASGCGHDDETRQPFVGRYDLTAKARVAWSEYWNETHGVTDAAPACGLEVHADETYTLVLGPDELISTGRVISRTDGTAAALMQRNPEGGYRSVGTLTLANDGTLVLDTLLTPGLALSFRPR